MPYVHFSDNVYIAVENGDEVTIEGRIYRVENGHNIFVPFNHATLRYGVQVNRVLDMPSGGTLRRRISRPHITAEEAARMDMQHDERRAREHGLVSLTSNATTRLYVGGGGSSTAATWGTTGASITQTLAMRPVEMEPRRYEDTSYPPNTPDMCRAPVLTRPSNSIASDDDSWVAPNQHVIEVSNPATRRTLMTRSREHIHEMVSNDAIDTALGAGWTITKVIRSGMGNYLMRCPHNSRTYWMDRRVHYDAYAAGWRYIGIAEHNAELTVISSDTFDALPSHMRAINDYFVPEVIYYKSTEFFHWYIKPVHGRTVNPNHKFKPDGRSLEPGEYDVDNEREVAMHDKLFKPAPAPQGTLTERLCDALFTLANHRGFITQIGSPTSPYREDAERLQAAEKLLFSTFERIGKRNRVAYDNDEDMTERAERVAEWIQNKLHTVVRGQLIAIYNETRDRRTSNQAQYAANAARDVLSDAMVEMIKAGEFGAPAMMFETKYGTLSGKYSGGTRKHRQAIDAIVSESMIDEDNVESLLIDRGFERCADCDEWTHEDNMRNDYHDDRVCELCVDDHYHYSDYHDCYVSRDDSRRAYDRHGDTVWIHYDAYEFTFNDELDMYVHDDYEPPREFIRSYHYAKGRDLYKPIVSDWTKKNDRFFGVELEVECRKDNLDDYAEKLNDALNDGTLGKRVFFENDGSLSNGFEIITQPMGLDTHYELWEWLQDRKLTTNLRSHDTSTCGLHVHISRHNINKLQINKMSVFLHSPDNRKLIETIARRYGVGYASMHEKKLGTAHHPSRGDPRYEALNITGKKTLELRIFKGTLKHDSMLAALEFTNALVNFTAPASQAGFVLTTPKFLDFIKSSDMRSETRFLRTYLNSNGITV